MKTFAESKTIWASVIIAIISMVWPSFIADNPEVSGLIVAAVNIVLRFLTKEPVVLK